MSTRPRILQVGPMPPPVDGGISAYLEGLRRSTLAAEFELLELDVRVPERFRSPRILRPLLTPVFVSRLVARLIRRRPDAVHIHSSDFMGFWEKSLLSWITNRRRIPVILHLHGGSFDAFFESLSPAARSLARRALAQARRVIVPARSWRPLLEQFVTPDRIVIVPNAVHCADFRVSFPREGQQPPRILFVGMLSERKGLDELLTAIRALVEDSSRQLQVDLVGGEEFPGELQRYRRRFHEAGLDRWVHFHGPKSGQEKLDFYGRADLFVLPSRNESFGIVNLEAMAAGLPVVSTRTGAIPEYLQDDFNGLLVNPGDARGLAQALRRLLDDPALRVRLGEAARSSVLDYDWSHVAQSIGDVYRSVVFEGDSGRDTPLETTHPH